MDFGTTIKHVAPLLIPLMALLIPIVAIAIGGWARVRRHRELHETIRQISSLGQPVPPELLAQVTRGDRAPNRAGWTRGANLRGGLINIGVGAGLIVFFLAMRPNGWLWAVGAIPLCLGIALSLAWWMERDRKDGAPAHEPGETF